MAREDILKKNVETLVDQNQDRGQGVAPTLENQGAGMAQGQSQKREEEAERDQRALENQDRDLDLAKIEITTRKKPMEPSKSHL